MPMIVNMTKLCEQIVNVYNEIQELVGLPWLK